MASCGESMNEGKPTKPKWWNRPRLQDPAGQAEGAAPAPRPGEVGPPDAEYISDGDFELARPDGVDSGRVTASGGDYELGRPDTGKGTAVSDGAPAVDRPDGVVTESAASAEGAGTRRSADAGHGQGTLPEGDFELRAPRAPEDVARGQADSGTAVGSAAEAAGGPVSGSKTAVSGAPRADGDFELDRPAATASVTQLDPAQASAPTGERPRPLHDPDPYSTPPYGEPGPWAPAPPVQHPAATTAQGTTAIPAPAAHHGAAIPTAPAPHGTLPQVPATAQGATPTPVSGTSAPAEVPHASPVEAPVAAPEPGMPAPGAPSSFAGPSPQSPAAASSPPPSQPSSTPWQNYDPWAPAPLQQNGAVVESKDKRRRRLKRALVGGAVALALVSGGVGGVIGTYLERNGGVGAVELPQAGKEPAGRAPDSVAGIAARALPSVVTLHVSGAEESGTGTGHRAGRPGAHPHQQPRRRTGRRLRRPDIRDLRQRGHRQGHRRRTGQRLRPRRREGQPCARAQAHAAGQLRQRPGRRPRRGHRRSLRPGGHRHLGHHQRQGTAHHSRR